MPTIVNKINSVILSGVITDNSIFPIVKRGEPTKTPIGWKCRIEYAPSRGRGWINVTHWDSNSPLNDCAEGAEIVVEGLLGFDSWESENGKRSQVTIEATKVNVQTKNTAVDGNGELHQTEAAA